MHVRWDICRGVNLNDIFIYIYTPSSNIPITITTYYYHSFLHLQKRAPQNCFIANPATIHRNGNGGAPGPSVLGSVRRSRPQAFPAFERRLRPRWHCQAEISYRERCDLKHLHPPKFHGWFTWKWWVSKFGISKLPGTSFQVNHVKFHGCMLKNEGWMKMV